MTELAARVVEEQRQAELIKALTEQIVELQGQVADLQTQLDEHREIAWLFDQLAEAVEFDAVVIESDEEGVHLDAINYLTTGPTLREAAMLAFEKGQ